MFIGPLQRMTAKVDSNLKLDAPFNMVALLKSA